MIQQTGGATSIEPAWRYVVQILGVNLGFA